MLNADTKILSKANSRKLKVVLPMLISSQQTAHIKNNILEKRFIGESGILISDIIEISDWFNIEEFDIKKAFESFDHDFLNSFLRKFGFGKNSITWIDIVINREATTQYFYLERVALQGDPISAYVFLLKLEILFLLIKKHLKITGIEIFEHCFLCTAYVDDTAFFLKDSQSIAYLVELFNPFSVFSGLKPNLTKCEIGGTGALKGVQLAVCSMKCIDLP